MSELFAFQFDQELEPVVIGSKLELTGWLVRRDGQPINGIRVLMRRGIFRPRTRTARRKRRRPEVAAAFPHLPDAWASGFFFGLRLRLGRNHLTFQVLDHERCWQTFHTATVVSYSVAFLRALPQTRSLVAARLRRRLAKRGPREKITSGFDQPGPQLPVTAPKRVDLFATSKSNLFILEIGALVAAGFRELGCEAHLHLDTLPSLDPAPGTLQIVVTPHEFYNLFLAENISPAQMMALTRQVHLLCTEQPDTHWFEGNVHWAHHSLGVADINPLGVAAYRNRGRPAVPLALGYHPMLQPAGDDRPHAARAYDLTFLGSITDRREIFFAQHADFFAAHTCHVRFVPLGFAKTEATRSYLPAAQRNELLSDSRLLLNLHYSEQKYFEWHRILLGLANGCCIISEAGAGYGELVPGRHFVMVEPEDVLEACRYFLAHPAEAETIARAGQDFVRTHLRQSQTCATYLEALGGGEKGLRAFRLPPDHAPASLASEFSRTVNRRHRSILAAALRKDFRHLFRAPEIMPPPPAKLSLPARQEHRQPLIAKRAEYRARFVAQENARARGEAAWEEHANAASRQNPAPQLTVLLTLYNYAHHLEGCLASIAAAAAQLPQPPEILIVNDASTDASLAGALRCLAETQLPFRVVDKKFNTGLADARNVGTQLARAPYIFMMDPDNLLFPAALAQLLKSITAGQRVAAYSMLGRFRGALENREGLLSHFDFDPEILVQGPYIDAMAMFRRDFLLQSGGYDNDLNQIGWFGWEDYDLWLRIAQRGDAVGFVPNTLCLYRHHDASMINATNLFELELVQCFIARYGELLARFTPRATVFGVKREDLAVLAHLAKTTKTGVP